MLDDELFFPKGYCDIGEISFKELFEAKKEWVDFTLTDMKEPKGLFLKWQQYCLRKTKENEQRDSAS